MVKKKKNWILNILNSSLMYFYDKFLYLQGGEHIKTADKLLKARTQFILIPPRDTYSSSYALSSELLL